MQQLSSGMVFDGRNDGGGNESYGLADPDRWNAFLGYQLRKRPLADLKLWCYPVPPLHDVLHLLALADLVDQIGGMVDQAHRGFAGKTGTPPPIHVAHAKAVEAKVRYLDLDEELLPPPRGLERELHGEFLIRQRPILALFRRRKRDFVLG